MKTWIPGLRWLLLFLLLVGLVYYVATHLDQFKVIQEIRLQTIATIIILHALLLLVNGFRYCIIARDYGLSISFLEWIRIFIMARFLNRIFPQTGSVYRAVTLKKEYNFSIADYLSSFAAFSYLDRFFAAVLTLLIILSFEPSLAILGFNIAFLLTLFCLLMIGFAVIAFWLERNRRIGSSTISKLVAGFSRCIQNPRLLLAFGVSSAIPFCISFTMNAICFTELKNPIQPEKFAVLSLVKSALNTVPITPGNMGAAETSYALVFAGMNGDPAKAIIVATIINICALLSVSATCGILQLVPAKFHNNK